MIERRMKSGTSPIHHSSCDASGNSQTTSKSYLPSSSNAPVSLTSQRTVWTTLLKERWREEENQILRWTKDYLQVWYFMKINSTCSRLLPKWMKLKHDTPASEMSWMKTTLVSMTDFLMSTVKFWWSNYKKKFHKTKFRKDISVLHPSIGRVCEQFKLPSTFSLSCVQAPSLNQQWKCSTTYV